MCRLFGTLSIFVSLFGRLANFRSVICVFVASAPAAPENRLVPAPPDGRDGALPSAGGLPAGIDGAVSIHAALSAGADMAVQFCADLSDISESDDTICNGTF